MIDPHLKTVRPREETIPRFSPESTFPPYSYVSGLFPHPLSDESGHSYGRELSSLGELKASEIVHCQTYLEAVDLFNHGFYWESHETWEAVWHALGRTSDGARFVQALIKMAAAGVKAREGRELGVRRHFQRAAELLEQAKEMSGNESLGGLSLHELITTSQSVFEHAAELIDTSPANVVIVLPFMLCPTTD